MGVYKKSGVLNEAKAAHLHEAPEGEGVMPRVQAEDWDGKCRPPPPSVRLRPLCFRICQFCFSFFPECWRSNPGLPARQEGALLLRPPESSTRQLGHIHFPKEIFYFIHI